MMSTPTPFTADRRRRPVKPTTLCWLFSILATLVAAAPQPAAPFLQRVERATPAARVMLVLNHLDTNTVLTRNPAAAFGILDAVAEIGNRTEDDRLIRYCQLIKDTYAKHSQPGNAENAALFLAVGKRAEQDDDPQIAAVCQHFAGQYYFLNGEYGKAFEYLLVANKVLRTLGVEHVPELSRYLYELAFDYYHVGNYETTIQLLNEAARYPAYNPNLAIQTYNTMGMAYTQLCQQKNAGYGRKAEQSYYKTRQKAAFYGDSLWIGIATGNLANLYMQQRNWQAALTALHTDYDIGMKLGAHRVLPNQTALNMAIVYAHQQQWDSCFSFRQQSMALYWRNLTNPAFVTFGRSLRDEQYLKGYYDVSRQYYRAVNNLPKAYAYADSLVTLNELLTKRNATRQIWLAEQKLLIQKHQLAVDAIEQEKNSQQVLFWIIGLVLVLLATVFFLRYRFARIKRRQDQVINAEKERALRFEKRIIEDELQRAKGDLVVFMDNLRDKNSLIDTITAELDSLSQTRQRSAEQQQIVEAQQNLLNSSLLTNDDWDEFRRRFGRVHPGFFVQLRNQFPDISPAEERLLALAKLRIDTRQMSRMLGISPESIRKTKYRMRKKLGVGGASHLVELLAERSNEPAYA